MPTKEEEQASSRYPTCPHQPATCQPAIISSLQVVLDISVACGGNVSARTVQWHKGTNRDRMTLTDDDFLRVSLALRARSNCLLSLRLKNPDYGYHTSTLHPKETSANRHGRLTRAERCMIDDDRWTASDHATVPVPGLLC